MASDVQRVRAVFLGAVEQPAAEREGFLDRECGADDNLRRRVDGLLRAYDQTGEPDPARAPAAPPAKTTDYEPARGPESVVAGRYRLVDKIGEGGMGEVWVARQEEPVRRKVALKLIKAGMDSKSVLARFEQERQALALMNHPNIAKVLDGGTTGGRPFFVMELVEGLPLTRFCDEVRLGIRERLELFVPVCQAVQHAHQKGIIHRDLKPSNILVASTDGKAIPKVIDFGLAKATGGRLTDDSLSTQCGAVIGTVEYMSPEQAGLSGQDIDTRADIYSLGVILYELLTGLRPFDGKRLRAAALDEMIRILREEEPPRPSSRLSADGSAPSLAAARRIGPKKLVTLMRGELDWVVMKCLEKQRDRRYETANGLARDVQRYLADEAVEARPPSARYRLRKLVRRNKGRMTAAALVLLALVGGIVATTWQAVRAGHARGLAEAQKVRAETAEGEAKRRLAEATEQRTIAQDRLLKAVDVVDRMMVRVAGERWGRKPELREERRKVLQDAVAFFEGLSPEEGEGPQARRAAVNARMKASGAFIALGDTAAARGHLAKAIAQQRRLVADAPGDAEQLTQLGTLLALLGTTELLVARYDEAEAAYQEAMALSRRAAERAPGRSPPRVALAECLATYGHFIFTRDPDGSAKLYDEAVTIARQLVADGDTSYEVRLSLASGLSSRVFRESNLGRTAEADRLLTEAEALLARLAGEEPPTARLADFFDATRIQAIGHRASLMRHTGKHAAAAEKHREALAITEAMLANQPGYFSWLNQRLLTLIQIAESLHRAGRGDESVKMLAEIAGAEKAILTAYPRHPWVSGQSAVLRSNHLIGRAKRGDLRDLEEGFELLLKQARVDAAQSIRYNAACAYSHAARKTAGLEKEEWATLAIAELKTLARENYFADGRMVRQVDRDPDLGPLRDREDYKAFRAQLGRARD